METIQSRMLNLLRSKVTFRRFVVLLKTSKNEPSATWMSLVPAAQALSIIKFDLSPTGSNQEWVPMADQTGPVLPMSWSSRCSPPKCPMSRRISAPYIHPSIHQRHLVFVHSAEGENIPIVWHKGKKTTFWHSGKPSFLSERILEHTMTALLSDTPGQRSR